MEKKKEGIQIQSVARAIEILECFYNSGELGISDISNYLGLNKSTAFGIVNTLASHGFLEQDGDSKRYKLGIKLFELGTLYQSRIDIRNEAMSICSPLAEKFPATIHIATHCEGEVIYIDKLDSGTSLISASNVGKRAPMHCTGVGKAMLAFLPESYFNEYIKFPLLKITDKTITDKAVLLNQLAEVRKRGYAFDSEEIEYGLSCIASPVLKQDGQAVLGISVSFPYGRIESVDIEEVKSDLMRCTDILSTKMGYKKGFW